MGVPTQSAGVSDRFNGLRGFYSSNLLIQFSTLLNLIFILFPFLKSNKIINIPVKQNKENPCRRLTNRDFWGSKNKGEHRSPLQIPAFAGMTISRAFKTYILSRLSYTGRVRRHSDFRFSSGTYFQSSVQRIRIPSRLASSLSLLPVPGYNQCRV